MKITNFFKNKCFINERCIKFSKGSSDIYAETIFNPFSFQQILSKDKNKSESNPHKMLYNSKYAAVSSPYFSLEYLSCNKNPSWKLLFCISDQY